MKRVLCVWLPDFPIQRLHCLQPELRSQACVLYRELSNRANVVMASRQARRRGVVAGTPLAEAQALLESAHFIPLDAEADQVALRALAYLCDRFSPAIGIEPFGEPHHSTSSCLLMEIASCAHLFGGESGLARQLIMEFSRQGYFVQIGIADTVGAAWGIACYGHRAAAARSVASPLGAPTATPVEATRSLPIEALRLPERLLETLHEFDLRTVGQLSDLPRESLPSRFGQVLTDRLDQMFGRQEEMLVPVSPPEPVVAGWSAEDSFCDSKYAALICEDLLVEILNHLESRDEGLLRLSITFKAESTEPGVLEVGFLRPVDSAKHIMGLIDLKLETEPIPEWLSAIEMRAVVTAPMRVRQQALFEMVQTGESETSQLIDRLSARLGNQAVVRPRLLEEFTPEQAVGYEPFTTGSGANPSGRATKPVRARAVKNQAVKNQAVKNQAVKNQAATNGAGAFQQQDLSESPTLFSARPLFVFPQPHSIRVVSPVSETVSAIIYWSRGRFPVRHFTRSERISTDWWREGGMVRRKYYQAEIETGARFWLYHDQAGNWFLHGLFE